MTLGYGLLLLGLGLLATIGFFWLWFKIQTPPKKKESDGNEVLRKSGFLGDDTV
jgi:hypothetical protein